MRDEWKHVMSLEDKACNRLTVILGQIPLAKASHVAKPIKSGVRK